MADAGAAARPGGALRAVGGVYTALKTTRYEAVLFLACDMPFVTVALMEKLVRRSGGKGLAVFTRSAEGPGFPFLLRRSALGRVERQLPRGQFSLRALAKACRARMVGVWRRQDGVQCEYAGGMGEGQGDGEKNIVRLPPARRRLRLRLRLGEGTQKSQMRPAENIVISGSCHSGGLVILWGC